MKLTSTKDDQLDDDYIDIKYRQLTPVIHKIFQLCNTTASVLLCEKQGVVCNVDVNDILYIEWVDNVSCIYTKDDVFSMDSPLVYLEDTLKHQHFIRVSKMALVNLYKIKSVSNGLHFRLTAEMINGENVVINRHYRKGLLAAIRELAKEISENV
ncbi:MAG: LytTR family transcriptional regulator DNA-binding domain-containing protein [Defluviitaleaceae bacterium]|nr:LytTR family transcriptional regulator DNA-binding domain-containing protein [Defluviitaleaceae bacterium]